MFTSSKIAERIKETAKEKNITAKEMLEIAGVGFNTITHMKTSYPRTDTLIKIADVLGCSTDYLLGRTDKKEINRDDENA